MTHLSYLSIANLILTSLSIACQTSPPKASTTTVETPPRQFIMHRLTIEQRRNGRVAWSGTARRADGDLAASDVQNVVITHHSQSPSTDEVTIYAQKGNLQLDEGKAHFEDVKVVDPRGSVLLANKAVYDEKAGVLNAAGPLTYDAQGMHAEAPAGSMQLETGVIDIEGPIRGRFSSQALSLPK